MDEDKISHIEITQIEEIEVDKNEEKNALLKKLFDKDGWKKDGKKIFTIVLFLFALVAIIDLFAAKSWGLRFYLPVEIVKYDVYNDSNFSFVFPKSYVLDKNEQGKFGSDYIIGFHLANDSRTGCDVRSSKVGINFSKSDDEISSAVSAELAKNVKGFDKFDGKRIDIDGFDAYKASFDLIDPIGNNLRINQVLLSVKDNNYLLVCGSGISQNQFFAKDFNDFFSSIRLR